MWGPKQEKVRKPCTQKSCSSRITPRELSGEKAEQWTVSRKMTRQKEQEDYRQKNERRERTGDSNIIHDSPEIPDRRTTSDILGFPLGMGWEGGVCVCGWGRFWLAYKVCETLLGRDGICSTHSLAGQGLRAP